ncbi:HAD family hydrolase [Schlesneria sp. DSM 10557]|uniref:HAD family hydrolase n=1 Tax=Schlesneria sp. DSM 10557 TaxID=3044399 RepID=UPI0035A1A7C0
MTDVRGVIFDLDGTLVDSRLDFDAMRLEMGLPQGMPILEGLEQTPAGPQRDRMVAIMRAHELRGADEAILFSGVTQFLAQIRDLGIPSAVLTRNSREAAERTLGRWNLTFSQVVTREDAPPKPDPAGPIMIARKWGIPVTQIVMVGDYLFDIEAGRRAGMRSVLFAPQEIPDYAHLADIVLKDFRDAATLLNVQSARSP